MLHHAKMKKNGHTAPCESRTHAFPDADGRRVHAGCDARKRSFPPYSDLCLQDIVYGNVLNHCTKGAGSFSYGKLGRTYKLVKVKVREVKG